MTPPITYIPSNTEDNSFFSHSFTYIPSTEQPSPLPLQNLTLPLSLFRSALSGVEAICVYLKDKENLRFCEIAQLLNRDDRSVWDAYNRAKKKCTTFEWDVTGVSVPLVVVQDRQLSFLESVVEYLREQLSLRYCEIARLIGKNDRTVWTVYNRARKKRKQHA